MEQARTLLLLRHASAEPFGAAADHERQLDERGVRQAQALGKWLAERSTHPTAVLASSALRVRQTLEHALGQAAEHADTRDSLFRADAANWLAAIRDLPEDEECPLLAGHNPVMGELASHLAGCSLSFGTCNLIVLQCNCDWAHAGAGCCAVAEHWQPPD